jgi:diguanylate cyclase (GGDEF)-like protein
MDAGDVNRAIEHPSVSPLIAAMRPGPRTWLYFLAGGLALATFGALVGDERAVSPVLVLMGMATGAAVLIGVRMNRPARALPWRLLAICTLISTLGIPLLQVPGLVSILGQAMAVGAALLGYSGFILIVRGRIPGGDRAAILDAAIIASGIGVLVWAYGLAPYVVAAKQTSIVAAASFYPVIVALAMVARLWFLPGAHRPATRLIVLLVVASNGIIGLEVLRSIATIGALPGALAFANFAELAFMGAAALHPTMALAPERHVADREPLSRRRLAVLTAALLVNPVVLAVVSASGEVVDPAPYVVGGVIIGLLVMARLRDALGQLGASLIERESLMDLLRRQALYDGLTALPNRRFFTERLAADFDDRSSGGTLALLLVDLDDFKSVNDRFGHEAGDALLVAVGQRLRASIREGDMAARLGGDEFVIILPRNQDPSFPTSLAERIVRILGEPYDIAGQRLTVPASVGAAVASPADQTPDDLVRHADLAMYEAKNQGKGRLRVAEPAHLGAA